MPPRKIFAFSIILLFVLCSAYLVLHYEYQEGRFFHYFYKANFYYSAFNKIIIPVYFWGCAALALFFLNQTTRFGSGQVLNFLRYAFLFHLYLLLLSHSQEITPGFTLVPENLAPAPLIFRYEQIFMMTGFIAYYVFAVHALYKSFNARCSAGEAILPISTLVPYFYLASPWIHMVYMGVAILLFLFLRKFHKPGTAVSEINIFREEWKIPSLIFVVGLFFRLWYAYYFSSFAELAIGQGADGPAYYKSAVAFSEGSIEKVDFWHAPFYSLCLAGFLALFGRSPETVFYSQAVVGSLTPVIVFLIARILGGKKVAVIAGLLAATSHLCIHYSVVVNRSALLLVTIPLSVYLCLKIKESPESTKITYLGLLVGATFYLGQETLPFLLLFVIALPAALVKKGFPPGQILKKTFWLALGIFITLAPLNLIHYNQSGQWIPLGRDTMAGGVGDSWNLGKSQAGNRMVEMGFNPLTNFEESISVFLSYPLKIISLLFGKFFHELFGFLLDPGGRFLMPLNLTLESFYGAHIQFYIYLAVFAGLIIFMVKRDISLLTKTLILFPIASQLLVGSIVLFGTFRFRAPITPLNMILAAFALKALFFSPPGQKQIPNETSSSSPIRWAGNFQARHKPWRMTLLAGGAVGLIFLGIDFTGSNPPNLKKAGHITHWTSIFKEQKPVYIYGARLNSTVFAFYQTTRDGLASNPILSFNICRFLMPGMKPYYRLAVDGRFLGPPKKIPAGCSQIREKFQADFFKGIVNLFVYVSDDGKTENPRPFQLNLAGGRKITIPVIPNLTLLDNELKEYAARFENYSYGYVKVSKPEIRGVP